MSLATSIRSIQDIMRKDVGVDGDAQRIGQLVWLLFLKIWDDRERELELIEDDFRSPLVGVTWQENGETRRAEDLRWKSWASDPEGVTGDGLLDFANNALFPALKGMEIGPKVDGDSAKARAARRLRSRRLLLRSAFEDAYQYMKSGTLLRQVINRLQADIDFNDAKSRHLFGDIYETILKGLQSAGNAGEYYTPRAVTQFAVDMVDPKLGETILDPACGTGGFLSCSIENVRKAQVRTPEQEARLQASIRGVEKKQLPHLLCVTNMIVHGIDVPTDILHDNTLSRPLRDIGMKDRVDVIMTNPPFGGMEEDGIENNFPAAFRTRETADLFLVLIVEMLKPGGRAAVVLPDGTLFGEGVKTRIKEHLLTECDLHTIVRLPNGVFAPYTSIKTNVLFFTKGRPTKRVWYYEHPYPEGYISYSKTKPMRIEEFEAEKAWWTDRKQTPLAWKVSIEQIREHGFNLDIANPSTPQAVREQPDALLAQLGCERAAAKGLLEELRKALSTALLPDRLIKSLEEVAEAPNGVAQLRELTRQLAVRGKLAQQDPKDEPVSSLLKRIAAEQVRLLKAGRIRMPKPLPPVSPEERPFVVPNGWAWVRLIDVAWPQAGFAFKGSRFNDMGVGTPLIRIRDIDSGSTEAHYDGEYRREFLVQKGDVLIGMDGNFNVRRWRGPEALLNQRVSRLIFYGHTEAAFIADALQDRLNEFHGVKAYTTVQHLSGGQISEAVVPLPPLPEQRRIVARVDELMGLLDRLEGRLAAVRSIHAAFAAAAVHHLDA
jgi:type I restriction enzyme M protein